MNNREEAYDDSILMAIRGISLVLFLTISGYSKPKRGNS